MTFFAWLATTRIGRWFIGVGAVILAALALASAAFLKGKHSQADKDKAKDAEAAQWAAQAAQETFTAATDAAAKVQVDAAKQPPPDPITRDDFDDTF